MFKKIVEKVRAVFSIGKNKKAPAGASGENKVLYAFPSSPLTLEAPIKQYERSSRAPRSFSAPAVVSPLKQRLQEIQSIDRKVQFQEWRKNNALIDELRNKQILA